MDTATAKEHYVRILLDAAVANCGRGQPQKAGTLLEEALAVSRETDKRDLIAAVRASQGVVERSRGNFNTASDRLDEALRLRRQLGDPLAIARALGDLGRVHLETGRHADARRCIDEALEASQPYEPGRTRAEILEHAGRFHAHAGDAERASACREEAARVYESIGDRASASRIRSETSGGGDVSERGLDEEIQAIERQRLVSALEDEGWNQSRAARRLGVTETRVRNLMRKHGLQPRNRRGRPRKGSDALQK